jgi:glycosyltransferase involved in cell wall biosynthesis
MKIALIHYSGPPTIGGVEQTMHYQAHELAIAGYAPSFIVGKGGNNQSPSPSIRIPRLFSLHPQVLAAKSELDKGQKGTHYRALFETLRDQLGSVMREFDVLIVHNALSLHKNLALTDVLWNLLSEGELPPLIGWHHDFAWLRPDYSSELHHGHPWDLLKKPWPNVTNVVVSQTQRQKLSSLYGIGSDEIHVIPPGIDPAVTGHWTELTKQIVATLGWMEAEALILLPARITRRKNIELAIQIHAQLRHLIGGDVRLIITGPPGPHNPANIAYLESLNKLVVELGVRDSIHFLYQFGDSPPLTIDDATMANFYTLCDVLLFPSKDEGFGIPVLEAGFTRMPIFCSDLKPFQESGQDQIHTFKLSEQPGKIAQRMMQTLFSDPSYILRRRILRQYTWQRVVRDKLIPLIERAANG